MKTKLSLTKFVTTLIIAIAAINILSSCEKDPVEITFHHTHTTMVNAIVQPNGIGLVSENNDTVIVVLEPISEITAHSGRATGNVTLVGESSGFGDWRYGIFWDTIQNPTISSNNCVLKNFSEDFSFLMYNLQPSTQYYVGLFLTQSNDVGNVNSNITLTYYRIFTTLNY